MTDKPRERKSKKQILSDIMFLTKRKAYTRQQLSVALGSHWLTVRECLDFLVAWDLMEFLETPTKETVYFWRPKE